MVDVQKLRKLYAVMLRLSKGQAPLSEEPLTSAKVDTPAMRSMFQDVAIVLASYGKILNAVSQSTDFTVGRVNLCQQEFMVTPEQLSSLQVTNSYINISVLVKNINESLGNEHMRSLTPGAVTGYLMQQGILEIGSNGKNRVASAKGKAMGIVVKEGHLENGDTYQLNSYSPQAQKYIIEHLPEIAKFFNKRKGE